MKYFFLTLLILNSFNVVFAQKKNKNGSIYTMTFKTYPKSLSEPVTDTLFFFRFDDRKGLNVMSKEKLVLSVSEKGFVTHCDSLDIKDTNMMIYSFLYRRLLYSHPDSALHDGNGYKSGGPIRLKGKSKNYAGVYMLFGESYFLSYQVHNNFITSLKVTRKHKVLNHYIPFGSFTIVKLKSF